MTRQAWEIAKELADGSFRTIGIVGDEVSAEFFRDAGYAVISPEAGDGHE